MRIPALVVSGLAFVCLFPGTAFPAPIYLGSCACNYLFTPIGGTGAMFYSTTLPSGTPSRPFPTELLCKNEMIRVCIDDCTDRKAMSSSLIRQVSYLVNQNSITNQTHKMATRPEVICRKVDDAAPPPLFVPDRVKTVRELTHEENLNLNFAEPDDPGPVCEKIGPGDPLPPAQVIMFLPPLCDALKIKSRLPAAMDDNTLRVMEVCRGFPKIDPKFVNEAGKATAVVATATALGYIFVFCF
jgi:hypothetical protein